MNDISTGPMAKEDDSQELYIGLSPDSHKSDYSMWHLLPAAASKVEPK